MISNWTLHLGKSKWLQIKDDNRFQLVSQTMESNTVKPTSAQPTDGINNISESWIMLIRIVLVKSYYLDNTNFGNRMNSCY